jgi:hypothetical protein
MEMDDEQSTTVFVPGNASACKRYYARNAKAAKRRVLLNEISRLGRISSEETYEKWDVTVHDIIDAFRVYKNLHPEDTKRLIKFRVLVGNLL